MQLNGAQILIQSLVEQGVDLLFGYPGGAVLNIYDALYDYRDQIRHIVTSHEQGAAHAADGYSRSTGKTGVVLATSGPGATNLVTGIATAYQDSVPLVAITGNVTRDLIGRDAFQEVDIVGISNPIVKHNYFVQDASDIGRIVQEAFVIANSGRKGPVLIDIPKDITAQVVEYQPQGRYQPRSFPPLQQDSLDQAAQLIQQASRPLIYAGGGVISSDSSAQLMALSQKIGAPVCVSMMGLSAVPVDYPLYLGMIGMHGTAAANRAAKECDLLITVGARFSDRVTGNRDKFASEATILHIDIDASEIGKNILSHKWLIGDCGQVLEALTQRLQPAKNQQWIHGLLQYKALNRLPEAEGDGDQVSPREVIASIHKVFGPDTIVVTDVGQHQMLTAQYYPFEQPRTFVSSCGMGTMGFGMGAAVGAKLANPQRPVVLVTGDGSFHMNMSEFAVAVSNNLDIKVLVLNNRVLGMVYQWQNLFYQQRFAYTRIHRKTDFAKLGEAFGGGGLRISCQQEILPVLTQAAQLPGPCVVDCVIDAKEHVYPIIPPGGTEADAIYSND